jgi:hypothetical protein
MKKKVRDIVVNGITYCWRVSFNNDGDGSRFLIIYKNNERIYDEKVHSDIDKITPKMVEETISSLLEN